MKIALFFGSFNPIHVGHLMIANYIAETADVDRVWFVVSPHNPFKEKSSLLNEYDRLHLVNLAIETNPKLASTDIEFRLPKPSYTIDTLTYLKEKFPTYNFSLIMGSDNYERIHKWKNGNIILDNFPIIVYQRKGSIIKNVQDNNKLTLLEMPLLDISSTFIREQIAKNISMKYFLPDPVEKYISEMNLFKSTNKKES